MSDFDGEEQQELLECFLAEAGELLEDVDSKLIELEGSPKDNNLLNTIFRGFHTIKGGAGFLSAHALVDLCHRTENLFDSLRSGNKNLNSEMLDTILAATGEVKRMFEEMIGGAMPTPAPSKILNDLESWFKEDDFLDKKLLPEKKEVFGLFTENIPTSYDTEKSIDIDWEALYNALVDDATATISKKKTVEYVHRNVEDTHNNEIVQHQQKAKQVVQTSNAAKENSIRIDTSRFDQILNLSGEIGLTKNRLTCLRKDLLQGKNDEETRRIMDNVIGQLDMLVSSLQTAVMKARMQPVGSVFKKYTRMARDVARSLGKDVELIIEGAETEVDKTILEELNDPLVHLVRNAVDHGIETIEERKAAGKSEKGTVHLIAKQDGDRIVIEITDDGRGMKPDVLRRKAVEKNCLTQEQANELSDKEALELILLPGFSTKTEITDISGRGVGMDVVRTNIQKLNGRIEIQSENGYGSKMTIFLPLTLAILPVLMLKLEEQVYSLPLSCVREILPIHDDNVQYVNKKPVLIVRGDVIPIINLSSLLGRQSSGTEAIGILAVNNDKKIILKVDDLLEQDEVMIKPLEGIKPIGISGATLSGEGLLVLVLDLRELLEDMDC